MTETISEFAPKQQIDRVRESVRRRQPESLESLEDIEDTIVQHRQAVERSTATFAEVPARDALTDIAIMLASLPLRMAMEMAEAVVTLPEFKSPSNKIELAMLLNEWAEQRLGKMAAMIAVGIVWVGMAVMAYRLVMG